MNKPAAGPYFFLNRGYKSDYIVVNHLLDFINTGNINGGFFLYYRQIFGRDLTVPGQLFTTK